MEGRSGVGYTAIAGGQVAGTRAWLDSGQAGQGDMEGIEMNNEGKCSQCIACGEAVGIGMWYTCECGNGPFCVECYAEHLAEHLKECETMNLRKLQAERREAIEMLKESLLFLPRIGANTRGVRCAPGVRSLRGRIMAFLDTAYGVRRGFN